MIEYLRYLAFWFLDFLRGGSFRKSYKDVKSINENYDSETSKIKRESYLNAILQHAIDTTLYYKNLDLQPKLGSFPVVNKNTIRDNFVDFESTLFKDKKKYKVATSGSTGTPFTTYLNNNKRIRNSVDTIYFAERSGFKLGKKLFYIRLWDEQHKKSRLSYWIQNIVCHDVSQLTDQDIEGLLKKITEDNSNKGFLAYASSYDAICHYLDKINSAPVFCNVSSIIAISEGLSDYARTSMKKYFCCDVVSRYSASETGILAQQSVGSLNYDINWGSYYIEILNIDDDEPVSNGELGRIVITDLFNYAVPMIRYDTGDLGVMILDGENKAPVLSKVEGRKMDMIYDTKGDLITSHIVHKICLIKGIKEYQLIQEEKKKYVFKISATPDFVDQEALIKEYKNYLGDDATIEIEMVESIPLLKSGKRKKVINRYYKN
ncbi:MAG: CoF synthetase [Flavobacteriaceae bacterium]|nr:MAG: CoF synthetase [Flavobacteriaceae bacterium]